MSGALPVAVRRGCLTQPRAVGLLEVAGTRVELRSDQPVTLAPFLAAHRHFAARAEGDLLQVRVLAGGAQARTPRIQFPELDTAAVRGLIDRGPAGRFERLHAGERDHVALYRDRLLQLTPALAHGPDGCDVLEPRLLGSYLELLLLNAALDRAPHLTAAHAAVVARGEQGALICGEGGAGKTTLTFALLRRGCAYLSDEVALLDLRAGKVQAYPRSIGVREGGLALLGDVPMGPGAFQTTSLTGDRKWLADPAAAAPAGIEKGARLEHLWFLVGFGPEPQIREVDPWQAAQRLARSLRHVRGPVMDRLWTAVEVVRRCRAREVVAGPPDTTACALIESMEKGGGDIA